MTSSLKTGSQNVRCLVPKQRVIGLILNRSGSFFCDLDNTAMESFFSSLETRTHNKVEAFDYIERFYNPTCRRLTLGYLSQMNFERQMVAA